MDDASINALYKIVEVVPWISLVVMVVGIIFLFWKYAGIRQNWVLWMAGGVILQLLGFVFTDLWSRFYEVILGPSTQYTNEIIYRGTMITGSVELIDRLLTMLGLAALIYGGVLAATRQEYLESDDSGYVEEEETEDDISDDEFFSSATYAGEPTEEKEAPADQ